MRIIGGRWRGHGLADPGRGDARARLRPTSDRVRESIFDLLAGGGSDPVRGALVLDLFAGTGALGLEAVSRGAAWATFVDDGAVAQALIRRNIATLDAAAQCRVLRRDATRPGRNPQAAHTLVFLDPPYGRGLGARALESAHRGGWMAPQAQIVWEDDAAQPAPAGFVLLDQRRYGDTWVTLLQAV